METTTEVAALPNDALAHVFRRLPARSLAEARSVCKAWRAVVDARELLLPHRKLLPHYVHGVFVHYIDHGRPHLFARPFSRPSSASSGQIDAMLGFLPNGHGDWWSVLDHCRGLVLREINHGSQLCVCNPATKRWALVAPPWDVGARWRDYAASAYLTFNPAMSTHYEILLIPAELEWPQPETPGCDKVRNERRAMEVRLHGVDDAPFCLDDWLQQFSLDVTEEEEEDEQEGLQQQASNSSFLPRMRLLTSHAT